MTLYIDTTQASLILIKLNEREFRQELENPRDQALVSLIDDSLKVMEASTQDLSAIEVNPGPGSFTGTRVGVTVANALAFALGISVNGQKPPVLPLYGSEPHITKPKL